MWLIGHGACQWTAERVITSHGGVIDASLVVRACRRSLFDAHTDATEYVRNLDTFGVVLKPHLQLACLRRRSFSKPVFSVVTVATHDFVIDVVFDGQS